MEKDRIRGAIAQMRLNEKLSLMGGGVTTAAVDGLNVPATRLSDELTQYYVKQPTTLALGCSFSPGLCYATSRIRAADAARGKAAFAGTVACGLIRDPMEASAAEFFSEDPIVTAELLKSYAQGGVLGYVFTDALGQGRFVSRTLDSRALYELYLYPLRVAGKYAASLQLDGGYLNGKKVSTSRTIGDIYRAYIPTDAMLVTGYGEGSCSECLEGNGAYVLGADGADKKATARSIINGELFENKLNRSIENTLMTVVKAHEFYKKGFDRTAPEVETAYDSSVLLENDGILPVKKPEFSFFGNAERFSDAAVYGVQPITSASRAFGKINVFLVDGYEENGIDIVTCETIAKVAEQSKTIVILCGCCAVQFDFGRSVNAIMFCPYLPTVFAAASLMTKVAPRGKLPFTWLSDKSLYPVNNKKYAGRGIFGYTSVYHGYTLFNNFSFDIRYPFGHGLDYTTYEVSKFAVSYDGLKIRAEFILKNAGKNAGTPVCQLYLSFLGDSVYGMTKRLAAFKRVPLEATENSRVVMEVDLNDLSVYDEKNNALKPLGGKYRVDLGLSSVDIRASADIKVPVGSRVDAGLSKQLLPSYYTGYNLFRPFEVTAPEIERLLKVPFIKKLDEYPELDPPPKKVADKIFKKVCKTTPPALLPLLKHKIQTTPVK